MSNISSLNPFSGSSRTLVEGKQVGASDAESLIKEMFSLEAQKEYAKDCNLGRYTELKANRRLNHIDLVPKVHGMKMLSLFRSEYDKGNVPSSGVLNIPRILLYLVRTSHSNTVGSITIRLVDTYCASDVCLQEAIDGQEYTVDLSSLPCMIGFSPTYDCKLEEVDGRRRCFGIVTELNGVIGEGHTVAMVHAYWKAMFRTKPGNYSRVKPAAKFIAPFDRLKQLSNGQLDAFIKGISNNSIDHGYLMGTSTSSSKKKTNVKEESQTSDPQSGGAPNMTYSAPGAADTRNPKPRRR